MTDTVYLVNAGCSFTAGTSDMCQAKTNPQSWGHFLLSKIEPRIYINLSMPGGGNRQTADNLTYLLNTKPEITPSNSLILFNISGLDRIDTMCSIEHPDANKNFSWSKDFGFGWITEGGFVSTKAPFRGSLQKNMELEQIRLSSCLAIIQLLAFLELKKFRFGFMTMHDRIFDECPEWFKTVIFEHYYHNYMRFGEVLSMHEFAKSKNLLASDGFHPNLEANQLVADMVYQTLIDNKSLNRYNNNLENNHV